MNEGTIITIRDKLLPLSRPSISYPTSFRKKFFFSFSINSKDYGWMLIFYIFFCFVSLFLASRRSYFLNFRAPRNEQFRISMWIPKENSYEVSKSNSWHDPTLLLYESNKCCVCFRKMIERSRLTRIYDKSIVFYVYVLIVRYSILK